jgi:hypothetical protein
LLTLVFKTTRILVNRSFSVVSSLSSIPVWFHVCVVFIVCTHGKYLLIPNDKLCWGKTVRTTENSSLASKLRYYTAPYCDYLHLSKLQSKSYDIFLYVVK